MKICKSSKEYFDTKFWRRRNFFLIVGLMGLFITLCGHFLDPRYKWVVKIFAPEYETVNKAYTDMLNNDQEIKKTDPVFDLIIDVISEYVEGPLENVSSLRAHRHAPLTIFGDDTGPSILLSITDRSEHTYKLKIRDLKPGIRKHFLEHTLLSWGDVIFYIGFLITLVLILAQFSKSEKSGLES